MADDSYHTGDNWSLQEGLLDICSILHTALQHEMSDKGVEAFVRLFKSLAPFNVRISAIPSTMRTMKKRIMEGHNMEDYIRLSYHLPDDLPIKTKEAPFVLKKFQAVLNECLHDPRVMDIGNFYFGDRQEHEGKSYRSLLS